MKKSTIKKLAIGAGAVAALTATVKIVYNYRVKKILKELEELDNEYEHEEDNLEFDEDKQRTYIKLYDK